ncbi:MAG: HD domain-containing protein [Pirellula sp.]|jgi:uncharacterized protein|nr:HD domain-containing protein [Pirellula sp.]
MNERATWDQEWRHPIEAFVAKELSQADSGHGIEHVRRVVQNALGLAVGTEARLQVLLPAAWLHDCVVVAKNSPQRKMASRLAAQRAVEFLTEVGYPHEWLPAIQHCIAAHSFSAQIPCETLEARLLQDADRLEALGAIGLARCLMTGGAMRQRLMDPDEPFPSRRVPDDTRQSMDHFFCKLLGLHGTMQTGSGRREAVRRTRFLVGFLRELGVELGVPKEDVERSLESALAESSDLVYIMGLHGV